MVKKKILFFHFDLGNGGAERVLVNLLNNLDKSKYNITLKTIFSGPLSKDLDKDIKFRPLFNMNAKRGSSLILRQFPTKLLYKFFVREKYDVEIAYLEQIPTRILGGGRKNPKGRKFAWIHNTTENKGDLNAGVYISSDEFMNVYRSYDKIAFVSKMALTSFEKIHDISTPKEVVHNVCEFEKIKELSNLPIDIDLNENSLNLCSVGRLCGQKGYDRLIKVLGKLSKEGFDNWNLYLIGDGAEKEALNELAVMEKIKDKIHFIGFKSNPHRYLARMDFFVCSSTKEGYSTAVTESVVLGIPVLTTDCAGMDEILDNGNAGIIVENSLDGLEQGLKKILTLSTTEYANLKTTTIKRGKRFSTTECIREFEDFINS